MAGLPPLPSYSLQPQPALLSSIPDKYLTLVMPIIAYWVLSLAFHFIDTKGYLDKYRLHTPAEVLKRNRVSMRDVIRDVFIQQVIQTIVGIIITMTEPDEFIGREEYDIAVWARRIRTAEQYLPSLLGIVGLDAIRLAKQVAPLNWDLGAALSGGFYPNSNEQMVMSGTEMIFLPAFASWELTAAKVIYYLIKPALQFAAAICFLDTWQYFLHRAMHMNQWMYRTFHSRHHRLHVPYAFGALYNHPFEGFLLDTLGAGLGFKVAGLTIRQGMCFFTGSTIKTIDDHCGYSLPFDPLQWITENNAVYHDVHHQSWGVKTNFSQPFFTFWDHLLGTAWTGGDVSSRYERAAKNAQRLLDKDMSAAKPVTGSDAKLSQKEAETPYTNEYKNATILDGGLNSEIDPKMPAGKAEKQAAGSREQVLQDTQDGGVQIIREEMEEEKLARHDMRQQSHALSKDESGTLKGLRQRMNSTTLPGCTGGVEVR